jgi:hypothetical protein
MSKTNYLQAVISDLQRTAGPYRCANSYREQMQQKKLFDHPVGADQERLGDGQPECLGCG